MENVIGVVSSGFQNYHHGGLFLYDDPDRTLSDMTIRKVMFEYLLDFFSFCFILT
jgi:hypothetical protein